MLPRPDTATATRRTIARQYKRSTPGDRGALLHIRCGTDILDSIARAGIPGDRTCWVDPLCEGPIHRHATDAARHRERAAYVAGRFDMPVAEALRRQVEEDRAVDRCPDYDETVLWFEADMFDQMILVYLLARLAAWQHQTRISLICIGAFPGVRRFIGLGQLWPAQLATLFPLRRQVTRRQFLLAARAWDAVRAPDPAALIAIGRMRSRSMPFLPAAVRRYLAEYPSTRNGLGRTEHLALEAIAEGARTPMEVFPRVQNRERRPYLGDSSLYATLRDLATARAPAITLAGERVPRLGRAFPRRELRLTETGHALLAGEMDWCAVSGRVRQLGGVTLRGARPRWRWDARRGVIVDRRSL